MSARQIIQGNLLVEGRGWGVVVIQDGEIVRLTEHSHWLCGVQLTSSWLLASYPFEALWISLDSVKESMEFKGGLGFKHVEFSLEPWQWRLLDEVMSAGQVIHRAQGKMKVLDPTICSNSRKKIYCYRYYSLKCFPFFFPLLSLSQLDVVRFILCLIYLKK